MKYIPNMEDVIAAILLLESHSVVQSWSLTRITNNRHGIRPYGEGFGIQVVNGTKPFVVWEKAGKDNGQEITITCAAQVAIKRLTLLVEAQKDEAPA